MNTTADENNKSMTRSLRLTGSALATALLFAGPHLGQCRCRFRLESNGGNDLHRRLRIAAPASFYAMEFREVKRLGGATSTDRTTEQTEVALFYLEGPATFWTRNYLNYPLAHSCNTSAMNEVLRAYCGTGNVAMTLTSLIPGTRTHHFDTLDQQTEEVFEARILAGFHFRSANVAHVDLGRRVGRYIATRYFQPAPQQ